MSLPIDAIKAALLAWVQDASTGFKILFADQNRPAPGTPHIVINTALTSRRIGLDDEAIWDADDAVSTLAAHRRVSVSLQAFGAGAVAALTGLQDALEYPTLYAGWFSGDSLAAHTPGEVRNLSGMLGSRYEQRAQMDVVVTCLNTDDGDPLTDDPGYFDALTYDSPALGILDTTIPE